MDVTTETPLALWPLAAYFGAVIVLVVGMLGLSYLLGERRRGRTTGEPYESGMVPTGSARLRFDVKFYLVAAFFVIFDLEAVFFFAWTGYIEVAIFVGVPLVALIYLPAPILLGAVLGTQAIATLIATFGLFMAPIGWQLMLFVWGYALVWFLVNDQVKLLGYRILDTVGPSVLSGLRRI